MPTDPTTGQFREPTNADRSGWARQALEKHQELTSPGEPLREFTDDDEGEYYPALDDLLANLLHLVGRERFDDALERAVRDYYEELDEANA